MKQNEIAKKSRSKMIHMKTLFSVLRPTTQKQTRRELCVWALLFSLSLASCVSVNLGPKAAEKSSAVEFVSPQKPFKEMNSVKADRAWFNPNNGNSISYLSTCNDPSDPSIESVTRDLFTDLEDLRTIQQTLKNFNGRLALLSEVEGKIDGVTTRIQALVFKKNNCTYTLSFIGIPKSFEQDRGQFDQFVRSFEAP